MKRYLIFFISFVAYAPAIAQQNDSIRDQIVAYKYYYDYSGLYRTPVDTSLKHYQIYNPAFSNFSMNQYVGNLGTSIYSNIASEHSGFSDFLFDQYIRYNFLKPMDIAYYTTRTPFTLLTYFSGGPKSRQEQKLDIVHVQNVNKKLSFGFLGSLAASDGEFINQKTSKNCFSLYSTYNGTRYNYHFAVMLNSLKSAQNGGVIDSLYENLTDIQPNTAPVYLEAAASKTKNLTIFLQHRFYITGSYNNLELEEPAQTEIPSDKIVSPDSIAKDSIAGKLNPMDSIPHQTIPGIQKPKSKRWNEVLSFIHQLSYEKSSRSYTDELLQQRSDGTLERDYYKHTYINSAQTRDSVYFRRLENTLLLAVNANPILKIPAELRVGLKNQMDLMSYNNIPVFAMNTIHSGDFSPRTKDSYINTALIGNLANRFSKTIAFGASAEFFFTGYKAGNLHITGDISKTIGNNFTMTLRGDFAIEKPGYYLQDYESNHFIWHNDFKSKQSTNILKAEISHEKLKIYLEGYTATYINYLYFNSIAMPEIADNPFTVFMVSMKKYIDLNFFHTMVKATFQQSSNNTIMPMPAFNGYNTSYIEFQLVKNVMRIQLGYDLFYHSAFYPKAFMPATGMYYVQNEKKTGNYPYADVFLNIKLKRVRFSLKYENFTSIFKPPKNYFLPHYPFNPGILKLGVSWTFYD
jgi:hypothetical protein